MKRKAHSNQVDDLSNPRKVDYWRDYNIQLADGTWTTAAALFQRAYTTGYAEGLKSGLSQQRGHGSDISQRHSDNAQEEQ